MSRTKVTRVVVPRRPYTIYAASGKTVVRNQKRPFKKDWLEQTLGGSVRVVNVPGEVGKCFLVAANETGKEVNQVYCQFRGTVIKADVSLVSVGLLAENVAAMQV